MMQCPDCGVDGLDGDFVDIAHTHVQRHTGRIVAEVLDGDVGVEGAGVFVGLGVTDGYLAGFVFDFFVG